MDEFTVAAVDPDVGYSVADGPEEDQVTEHQFPAVYCLSRLVLFRHGPGDRAAVEFLEDTAGVR